jgi:hypothetical protein
MSGWGGDLIVEGARGTPKDHQGAFKRCRGREMGLTFPALVSNLEIRLVGYELSFLAWSDGSFWRETKNTIQKKAAPVTFAFLKDEPHRAD